MNALVEALENGERRLGILRNEQAVPGKDRLGVLDRLDVGRLVAGDEIVRKLLDDFGCCVIFHPMQRLHRGVGDLLDHFRMGLDIGLVGIENRGRIDTAIDGLGALFAASVDQDLANATLDDDRCGRIVVDKKVDLALLQGRNRAAPEPTPTIEMSFSVRPCC